MSTYSSLPPKPEVWPCRQWVGLSGLDKQHACSISVSLLSSRWSVRMQNFSFWSVSTVPESVLDTRDTYLITHDSLHSPILQTSCCGCVVSFSMCIGGRWTDGQNQRTTHRDSGTCMSDVCLYLWAYGVRAALPPPSFPTSLFLTPYPKNAP